MHTIANSYVIMGFNGATESQKRTREVAVAEADRVIRSAIEIVEYFKEFKKTKDEYELDIKVGIHTGGLIAGICGSKVVRYDIYGEDIQVTKAIKANSEVGRVSISNETW